VRQEFFRIAARKPGETFTLLVTGGSQGSRTLNQAGRDSWPLFAKSGVPIRIVHQAGRGNAAPLAEAFARTELPGEVVEFIADMPAAFAQADLVVCRAGASTVSELAAAGRASLLVPFPYAADDHQQRNAEAMARAGAARVVPDSEMSGRRMFDEVIALYSARDRLAAMARNAREMAKPRAAERAADVLEQIAVR
jgi:UDP-N-acetylglucosamine--N-acetylmuramyl-(pentapeptide) pyrophosphoryl-undecaprenol N-acetylglucosamine transferase